MAKQYLLVDQKSGDWFRATPMTDSLAYKCNQVLIRHGEPFRWELAEDHGKKRTIRNEQVGMAKLVGQLRAWEYKVIWHDTMYTVNRGGDNVALLQFDSGMLRILCHETNVAFLPDEWEQAAKLVEHCFA